MSRVEVRITVGREARDLIYRVATLCRARGFGHTSTHSDLGILVGSAEVEDLPFLRAVPGVVAVDMEEEGRPSRGSRRSPPVSTRSGATLRGGREATPEL